MLNETDVVDIVRDLWADQRVELVDHDRVYGYLRGRYGVPDIPEGASEELHDLAKLSVKNVLRKVRDSFALPLQVVGFRAPGDTENDSAVWEQWQAQRLDRRQGFAHRATVSYGTAYGFVEKSGVRLRTPRQAFAKYADPHMDEWPVYALEVWIDQSGRKPLRRGRLFDETHVYPITLGNITRDQMRAEASDSAGRTPRPVIDGDPVPHGFDYTPVARFVNDPDAEEAAGGEIEPLITRQRALNVVNFDRLVVIRYGAFQQKYAIGWAPENKAQLLEVSAQRLLAFDDPDVSVGSFPATDVSGYNSVLTEMMVDIALDAKIPPENLTGGFSNLSADALAVVRADYEAKLRDKRTSFGETWEQIIRAFAEVNGVKVPDDAEVVWETGEARSYAQVVDGISKLQSAGVPIEALLEDIPGWTQQRIDGVKATLRRSAGRGVLDALRNAAGTTPLNPAQPGQPGQPGEQIQAEQVQPGQPRALPPVQQPAPGVNSGAAGA